MSFAERTINQKKYSYASIRTNMLGRNVIGITSINYGDKKEVKPVRATGEKPIGYTEGNYEASCDIELLIDETEGIIAALPPGLMLQDIAPFDITVVYLNDGTNQLVTHIIKGCKFMDNMRSNSGGSTDALKSKHQLYVGEIIWNPKQIV